MFSKREKGTVAFLLLRAMGLIVSFVMVAGIIAGVISRPVQAEPTDLVAYSAVEGTSAKITETDGTERTVYSIGRGSIVSSDKEVGGEFADVRTKADAASLGNEQTRGTLAGVLYYGYPKNASGLNATYADTKKAVELALDFGGKELPESDAVSDGAAAIYKAAVANPVAGAVLCLYAPVAENNNETYPLDTVVGASFDGAKVVQPTAVPSEMETVKKAAANNVTKQDDPADPKITIKCDPEEIKPEAGQKIKVTITYSGLNAGQTYDVKPEFKNGDKGLVPDPEEATFEAAESGEGTENIEFTINASACADGDTIDVIMSVGEKVVLTPDAPTSDAPQPIQAETTVKVKKEEPAPKEDVFPVKAYIERIMIDGAGEGRYVEDIKLEVKDEDGNLVGEAWTTAEKAQEISIPAAGTYTITENGELTYTFKVDEEGKIGDLVSENPNSIICEERNGKQFIVIAEETDTYRVTVSKVDENGKALKGATISVRGEGISTMKFTSEKEAKELDLPVGSYTLRETKAPNGYQRITTTIKFSVDAEGIVTLETKKVSGGKVSLSEDKKGIVLTNAKKKTSASNAKTTKKSASTSKSKNPKTGDENPVALWSMMLVVAVMTIIVFSRGREKN